MCYKNIAGMCVGMLLSLGSFAHAVTINSDYLVGTVEGAQPSSPVNELAYLNQLVNLYNSGFTGSTVVGGKTYDVNPGSQVSAIALPNETVPGNQVPTPSTPTSLSIDLGGGWHFLYVKIAQTAAIYYIEGLTGVHTYENDVVLNNNGRPQGVSHYALVPDAGATLSLMGMSLLGLAYVRRKLTA